MCFDVLDTFDGMVLKLLSAALEYFDSELTLVSMACMTYTGIMDIY